MTLGEYIKQYREAHGLSQRKFAELCGVSNGYISMLEKNVNPKTGKPVTPQLERIALIAEAMGITVQDLCKSAGFAFGGSNPPSPTKP